MTQPAFDEVVTLVVKHRVKAGFEEPYEAWLKRIVQIAASWPGHLGVDVIRGTSAGLLHFTCVLRFTSTAVMQQWLDSDQRLQLVKEAEPMLADGDQTEVNALNEFWFSPQTEAAAAQPPRWKQAVVSLCVILPLTLLVPLVWGPLLRLNAFLSNYVVSTFLITLTIVIVVCYVSMPLATRLFAPWLSPAVKGAEQEPGHDRLT